MSDVIQVEINTLDDLVETLTAEFPDPPKVSPWEMAQAIMETQADAIKFLVWGAVERAFVLAAAQGKRTFVPTPSNHQLFLVRDADEDRLAMVWEGDE